jgi:hypothetical protein
VGNVVSDHRALARDFADACHKHSIQFARPALSAGTLAFQPRTSLTSPEGWR